MISLSFVQNDVFDRLMNQVRDPSFFPGWWKQFGQPIYAQAQQARWMSEGGSEGFSWPAPLNTAAKERRFKDYYGGGTKTLIATSRLLASVLPPAFRGGASCPEGEEQYNEIVSDGSVIVASNVKSAYIPPASGKERKKRGGKYGVNYGVFVNEHRPFTKWSTETRQAFSDSLKQYVRAIVSARQS